MKITNSEVISSGEKELIDAITGDLDWGAIEKVFKERHQLGIEEDVEYKNGDIVVHNNQVAYKLDFEVKVILSVLLDREGNYISVTSSGGLGEDQAHTPTPPPPPINGEGLEADEEGDELSEGLEDEAEAPELPVEDSQTENGSQKPKAEDDTKLEDGYKEALSELDPLNTIEEKKMSPSISPDEDSQERISLAAAQGGKMMEELADED